MKTDPLKILLSMILGIILLPGSLWAQGPEFTQYEMGFKNFLTCELTRTDAKDHFQGKAFKINMIHLFDIQPEGDMMILTGAVQCFVEGKAHTLFAALGVNTILDREKVSFYTLRTTDFSLLATELIQYPYKERCPWTQYWVDMD